jgi:DNA-binding response OmpR family regulator
MAHVLVIEDERSLRDFVREALERAGHEVSLAADGRDGLRQCRASRAPVDLVITDLIMPEQEGLETIMLLRRERPALPVIAMSGGGGGGRTRDLLATARILGAARTLAKPFRLAELLTAVHELLPARTTPPDLV